jgi:hypothetical protein
MSADTIALEAPLVASTRRRHLPKPPTANRHDRAANTHRPPWESAMGPQGLALTKTKGAKSCARAREANFVSMRCLDRLAGLFAGSQSVNPDYQRHLWAGFIEHVRT